MRDRRVYKSPRRCIGWSKARHTAIGTSRGSGGTSSELHRAHVGGSAYPTNRQGASSSDVDFGCSFLLRARRARPRGDGCGSRRRLPERVGPRPTVPSSVRGSLDLIESGAAARLRFGPRFGARSPRASIARLRSWSDSTHDGKKGGAGLRQSLSVPCQQSLIGHRSTSFDFLTFAAGTREQHVRNICRHFLGLNRWGPDSADGRFDILESTGLNCQFAATIGIELVFVP